jgi:GrpB-like predicted nucleotidyltransferase (UPF0157 family)
LRYIEFVLRSCEYPYLLRIVRDVKTRQGVSPDSLASIELNLPPSNLKETPSANAMPEFDISRKSRPVVVTSYQPHWVDEFTRIAKHIRDLVGHAATRIDHIGSTAVPGLGAKDIIDIQITVSDLDKAAGLTSLLKTAGFRQRIKFQYDVFRKKPKTDPELRKLFMREPDGERRAHIHIRELGRFNQRYALLFRDYLRSSQEVRAEYELLKRRAAGLFPESIDDYLFLKDPVEHIIYEAASLWAEKVRWSPDEDYV